MLTTTQLKKSSFYSEHRGITSNGAIGMDNVWVACQEVDGDRAR